MANWEGIITDAGAQLLQAWVDHTSLRITSAAAGAGSVDTGLLASQTALVSRKQPVSLIGSEPVEGGVRLKLRLTAPETAYVLQQIGVWAQLEDGEEKLLAVFQNRRGYFIPDKSASPDFVFTFYALISCNNSGNWTVNLDVSALASQEDILEAADKLEEQMEAHVQAVEEKWNDSLHTLREDVDDLRADLDALSGQISTEVGESFSELTGRVTVNESKIATLWDAIFTNITGNPFTVAFSSLSGITVTAGVWNAAKARLEC